MIPPTVQRVLDIGCSTGVLGEQLMKHGDVEVVGVEIDPRMAEVAAQRLSRVINSDIETTDPVEIFSNEEFDCIIFADTLEHLKNPWETLAKCARLMSDRGVIVASIPNVGHITTISNLLFRRYWPYRERGIHDKTHLRFFTLRNIIELFDGAGLTIAEVSRNYRLFDAPHQLNVIAKVFAVPLIRDFFTYQYIVVARRTER